ncbi:MAG: hypothetical protein ACPGVD_09345, partial [Flavobacteriales bacterium]
ETKYYYNSDTTAITLLIDNGDGTFSYVNELDDTVMFNTKDTVLTSLSIVGDTLVYLDENGDETKYYYNSDTTAITLLIDNGDGTFSYVNELDDTVLFNTKDTVLTTLTDNNDGTFTYKSEDGTMTTFDAKDTVLTEISLTNDTLIYKDENGVETKLYLEDLDTTNELIDTVTLSNDTLNIVEAGETFSVKLKYVPTYLCQEDTNGVKTIYRLKEQGNIFINEVDTSVQKSYQELLDSGFVTCESGQNTFELTDCKRRQVMSDNSSIIVYFNDSVDSYDADGILTSYSTYADYVAGVGSGLTVSSTLNCFDERCLQIGNVQYKDNTGDNMFANIDNSADVRTYNALIGGGAVACSPINCQQVYGPSDFGINSGTGLPTNNPACTDLSATWFDGSSGELFSWDVSLAMWVQQPSVNTVSCPQGSISASGTILSSIGVATVTKSGTGRYKVTLAVPQDNSDYVVLLTKEESIGLRDALHIDVIEGTKTNNAFEVMITEGDNGTAANNYRDRNWVFNIPCSENFSTGIDSMKVSNDSLIIFEGDTSHAVLLTDQDSTNELNELFYIANDSIHIKDAGATLSLSLKALEHTGTTGSIFFAGSDGTPTEKNDQLFWDSTNNRLGIGTDSPTHKLQVIGQVRATSMANANGTAGAPAYRFHADGNTGMYRPAADNLGFSTGGTQAILIDENQNVGIGVADPTESLDVDSTIRLRQVDTTSLEDTVLVITSTGVVKKRAISDLLDSNETLTVLSLSEDTLIYTDEKNAETKLYLQDLDSTNEKIDTMYIEGDSIILVEGGDTLFLDYQDDDWKRNKAGALTGLQSVPGNSIASGDYSLAGGLGNAASGFTSISLGGNSNSVSEIASVNVGGSTNTVTGRQSSNLGGTNNLVSGFWSSNLGGTFNTVSGDFATVIGGTRNTAYSYGETVLGFNSSIYTPGSAIAIDTTDKLLVVGNGLSIGARSNALTLLKDGRLGLGVDGDAFQTATLHIKPSTAINPLRVEGLVDSIAETNKFMMAAADGTVFTTPIDSIALNPDSSEWIDQGDYILARRAAFGGDTVVVGDNGNFGIGTSNPLRKMHFNAKSAGTLTALAIENSDSTDNNGNVVSFRTTTSGAGGSSFVEMAGFQVKHTDHSHATRSTDFSLFAKDEGENPGGFAFLTLKGNNNVGIGTQEPLKRLHILANNDSLLFEDLAGNGNALFIDTNGMVYRDTAFTLDSVEFERTDTMKLFNGTQTINIDVANTMAEIYDVTGGALVDTNSSAIDFATEDIVDAGYTTTDSSITVTKAGRYKITYRATLEMVAGPGTPGGNRSEAQFNLFKNNVIVPGTLASSYHRNTSVSVTTANVVKVLDLIPGDKIKVKAEQTVGAGVLRTKANGSSLLIERL